MESNGTYVIHAKPDADSRRRGVDIRGVRALLKRIGRDYGLHCTIAKWEDKQDGVESKR